jgi:hypothetical protein
MSNALRRVFRRRSGYDHVIAACGQTYSKVLPMSDRNMVHPRQNKFFLVPGWPDKDFHCLIIVIHFQYPQELLHNSAAQIDRAGRTRSSKIALPMARERREPTRGMDQQVSSQVTYELRRPPNFYERAPGQDLNCPISLRCESEGWPRFEASTDGMLLAARIPPGTKLDPVVPAT